MKVSKLFLPLLSASWGVATASRVAADAREHTNLRFLGAADQTTTTCLSDADCNTSTEYCAQGVCLEQSKCMTRADCFNPSNSYGIIECEGPIDCDGGQCTRYCRPYSCLDGTDFVNCFNAPCQGDLCEGAVSCVDEYCGGCNALHFDAAGHNICKPGTFDDGQSSAGPADGTCLSNGDCLETQYCGQGKCHEKGGCSLDVDCYNPSNDYPSVDCLGPPTCNAEGKCEVECGSSMCPAGLERVQCDVEPCNARVACIGGPVCVNDYCGGCKRIYFDTAGFQTCKDDGIHNSKTPQEALDDAKALWTSFGLTTYDYGFAKSCFCTEEFRQPLVARVEDGALSKVTTQYGEDVSDDVKASVLTVESLFDLIQAQIDDSAASISVRYHELYGYPKYIFVDEREMVADDEATYDVRFLVPVTKLRNEHAVKKKQWADTQIGRYTYSFVQSCECAHDGVPYDVTVRDGVVISATPDSAVSVSSSKTATLQLQPSYFPTLDDLFGKIEQAMNDGSVFLGVTYDADYGYPKGVSISDSEVIADGAYNVAATLKQFPVPENGRDKDTLEEASDEDDPSGAGAAQSKCLLLLAAVTFLVSHFV